MTTRRKECHVRLEHPHRLCLGSIGTNCPRSMASSRAVPLRMSSLVRRCARMFRQRSHTPYSCHGAHLLCSLSSSRQGLLLPLGM